MSGLVALLVYTGACSDSGVAGPTSRFVPTAASRDAAHSGNSNSGSGGNSGSGATGGDTQTTGSDQSSTTAQGNGGSSPANAGDHVDAPTNLTAHVSAGGVVDLSWDAVANAGQYMAQVDGAGKPVFSTSTAAQFTGLSTGTHVAKVRARSAKSASQGNTDNGWSESTTIQFVIDLTPPEISATVVGALGSNGWYTSDVTISWTVTDLESGVASSSCPTIVVNLDTPAATANCSATNGAGLASSKAVTVKRDATKPVVAFSGNHGTYRLDEQVNVVCNASDAMSGIASADCVGVSGDAYTFSVTESTSRSANGLDNAGNTNSASTSFSVIVDAQGLCGLTKRWVSNAGVANSLCVKLTNAAAAGARGDAKAKANMLGAYANEVTAQAGKTVSAANAALLLHFATML